ncbi:FKBP-type peptidyl-prolyl cis-trans isomerase [Paludisphaera mucosa]|uniref:Peptidyl-prolyl cis-trans isomerase n=1 Tax=Paludisphaera mucosa TaxID=3030827 RepID=A0ABT6FC75_9BACT|nr:FKBP-type peptidyl-prolyl cis-trans isomerase [Paludisphaera mucosa]MDG3005193.1 FKBP-type peptidyl-prolyl cis-trans isomerase [Paludisphaera mucosa]
MRRGLLGVWGIVWVSLGLPGCGDPGQIVAVMPPGAIPIRKVAEGDVAQAQGETPRPAKAAPGAAPKGEPFPPAPPTAAGETKTLEGNVKYETIKAGTGEEVKSGRVAVLHYVGTLDDGSTFQSSRERGAPVEFTLGTGGLIKGWEYAIPGMKVGEIRKIVVPPEMGYGAQDKGKIPPNSTLTFEVELVGVK